MRISNGRFSILALSLAIFAWTGGTGTAKCLTLKEELGGLIYRDTNLSLNFNQSCMTCHHPSAGFADPQNRRDPVNFPVSNGSDPSKYGGRNAPTSAYAGFSPVLQNIGGTWVGGMFWDGRATGWELGDPLAEQARGPFQNPVEMGLSPTEVVQRVASSRYANLFLRVYPDTNFSDIDGTFNNIARAIAAFERSKAVTKFNSKFDQFWLVCQKKGIDVSSINMSSDLSKLPQNILSTDQLRGLALFNDTSKGKCSTCHSTKNFVDNSGKVLPPLFTDFTYDNLGIPTNPRVYELAGGSPPDLGLGGFLGEKYAEQEKYAAQNGKFKVATLRNVAKSAPYGHNGYFATLPDIVSFYNDRPEWPKAEYPETVNTTDVGNLGLTLQEEKCIVSFLRSLTD